MNTRRKRRGDALSFLEKTTGGPLTFSKLIEAIRLGEEMSQAEFARTLGVSRAHLCDIEKGRRFVSPEKGAEFARILGYSEERFIKLVLQDQLRRARLDYKIEIEAT
ncbi:MAG: helix-turn-helix transcriptional regulator [Deltaproteobacteria bacterium]|nr:helix-turn-helix transcriptional regulator [Deltaproteobacteria bacterium]